MRSGSEEPSPANRRTEAEVPSSLYTPMEEDNEDTNQSSSGCGRGRKHGFFQRSESTLCLGCPPPDPFSTPMSETLPLADQPHLLTPGASREDLFGAPCSQVTEHANP